MNRKIVAVSDGSLVPSTRYRVDPILAGLKELGWDSDSIYGYGQLDQRIKGRKTQFAYRSACRILRAWKTASIFHDGPVLLQRLALPFSSLPELALLKRNNRVVFDFDDAIYLNRRQQDCPRRRQSLRKVFSKCRHVIAGNDFLAEQVEGLAPITVIPSCIDTDIYCPLENQSDGPPIIGWMGTSGNFPNLKQLIKPLAELKQRHDFKFVICSDRQDVNLFQKLDADFVRWNPQIEVATLQSFDIGIMPLDDTAWTRGKCSFKLIQYMSVGRAAVASPVGMNRDVIDGQNNGLFANEQDWFEPLDLLLSNKTKRVQMGTEARKRVLQEYSTASAVAKYDRLFASLA